MTLDEMLALLPDNTTGAIDAADLRAIVTDLHALANTYGQVFGYQWQEAAQPQTGKVTMDAFWLPSANALKISETTDDGQVLTFATYDTLSGVEISILSATGSVLKMHVEGQSFDQGAWRQIPISVTSITGPEPAANEHVSVFVRASAP